MHLSATNTAKLTINDKTFDIVLENNPTAQDFAKLLPLTLSMSDHLNNEKYATLSTSLPTNDKPAGQIKAGDVMLYQDDTLVIFYESFKSQFRYTKIGRIANIDDLKTALGAGDVKVMIELFNADTKNLSPTQDVSAILEKRYFRNCSCLHKRKDNKPTYLYDEISDEEAQSNADNQAYWIGYFDNQILIRYEKVYRGEVMIAQDVKNDKPF